MTNQPTTAVGPYTPIRRSGDTYYISGVIGLHPATKTAASDITSQTTQVFENLKSVLQTQGLMLDDIVKTTVFLTNMGDFSAMNDVYVAQFTAPRPARSCVGVAELPRVANVPLVIELEAIAYRVAV
jgi:2-iminobutanoate/2-iminopropanoate deaminase